jgi:hypothetical protein
MGRADRESTKEWTQSSFIGMCQKKIWKLLMKVLGIKVSCNMKKYAFFLIALILPSSALALHIRPEDWDEEVPLSIDSLQYIYFGGIIFLGLYIAIRSLIDYIKEPSEVRAKRKAMEKDIKNQHHYSLKEDFQAYIWHGTYYDKPVQILKGEKCFITDAPNDKGWTGVQMLDGEKYKRKLSIQIDSLERE